MVEERKIIMPYGADVAFHCQKCGGFVDEYGKCQFCGSQNHHRYEPKSDIQLYVEVDGNKKFYFNHVLKIDAISTAPPKIDVTSSSDTSNHYVIGKRDSESFELEFAATEDALFKGELMQNTKLFTLNMSVKNLPKVFRMRCESFSMMCMEKSSESSLLTLSPTIMIHDMDGWVDASLEAPDDARCPNCGAPIRKTYGLCDYCGGWVEYR